MGANEPRLRVNTYSTTDRSPRQEEAGCWWKGPGHYSFYTMFIALMIIVAKQRGWETNQIENIRVANLEGDPRIWLWPTDGNDPDRIPLRRYKGRITANLSTIMIKWKLALPSGQQNRYDILKDEAGESPVGPAVYIHKDKVLDTKWVKRSPRKKAAPSPQSASDPSQH